MNVDSAIIRMKGSRSALVQPEAFYRKHLDGWRKLASDLTRQTLAGMKPSGTEPAVWVAQVDTMALRVAASFFAAEEIGVVISLANLPTDLDPEENPNAYRLRGVGVKDVERFVAAGRVKASRDDPGKNLDERDANKSDLQIAWRIMWALKLQKPGSDGLNEAIRKFLGAEAEGVAEGMLSEVLKAWVTVFTPLAVGQWRDWVHSHLP